METIEDNAMLALLTAPGPDPRYAEQLDLYGQFVGSWDVDNRWLDLDTGEWREITGHWHFGWVLGGRAVQDTLEFGGRRHGTTVRLYDPKQDVWRVVWFAISVGDICVLVGRRDGDGIFQEGTQPGGAKIRWIFSEIEADSFLWRGSIDRDGTGEWTIEQEMRVRRSADQR